MLEETDSFAMGAKVADRDSVTVAVAGIAGELQTTPARSNRKYRDNELPVRPGFCVFITVKSKAPNRRLKQICVSKI
jgi:hypothetical protein